MTLNSIPPLPHYSPSMGAATALEGRKSSPASPATVSTRVIVHLDGRHPYLHGCELDFETRDVVLTVPAKSWNDAENAALKAVRGMPYWRASVRSISSGAE